MDARDALALVQDSEKFKARLKQLADAEKAAQESSEAASRRNRELNLAHDAAIKEHQKKLEALRKEVAEAEEAAKSAMKPVVAAEARVAMANKRADNERAKVKEERALLEAAKEKHAAEVAAFKKRRDDFDAAVRDVFSRY